MRGTEVWQRDTQADHHVLGGQGERRWFGHLVFQGYDSATYRAGRGHGYPPDRLRGKAASLAQIEEAMKEGIASEDLLRAVQAYATDSAGFNRSKGCFSDNWFQSRRWQDYVKKQSEDREKAKALGSGSL